MMHSDGYREVHGGDGPVAVLGRLPVEPSEALKDIAHRRLWGSGLAVMVLALFGRALVGETPAAQGVWDLLRHFLVEEGLGLVRWIFPVLLLHLWSQARKKTGSWQAFLALTGWAGVLLWAALPWQLAALDRPSLALLLGIPKLALGVGYYALWVWGLRLVYGWSTGGALFSLAAALSLAKFLTALVQSVSFLRTFFP